MSNTPAQYDFILFGATSFVGASVIRYITTQKVNDTPFTWAVAARNPDKMRDALAHVPEDVMPDQLIADATDLTSLQDLCAHTKVIMSTVGPYALYGETILAACVESGTDYCDLTGETHWMMQMIRKYQQQAVNTGARIVHAAGFDSIPSDIGMMQLQHLWTQHEQAPCQDVIMGVKSLKGGLSGGTIASMVTVIDISLKNAKLRRALSDPYALCSDSHPRTDQRTILLPRYSKRLKSWLAPFVMASVNAAVIHRSNQLSHCAYGQHLSYTEAVMLGPGMKGCIKASLYSCALGAFFIGIAFKPTRWLMNRCGLTQPGDGPSPAAQDRGSFELIFSGRKYSQTSHASKKITLSLTGQSDPGYGWTAKALTQSALCLAQDNLTQASGGFWTPASLLGSALTTRLLIYTNMHFKHINT
ncbi:MAG: saccharopine dehydrogenase NADP-binding domain-containing protein [Pseudomonadota bacterium]